jgi:hypothetical protein
MYRDDRWTHPTAWSVQLVDIAIQNGVAQPFDIALAAAVLFSGSVPRVSRRSHNSSETHRPDPSGRQWIHDGKINYSDADYDDLASTSRLAW